jgi:hypothetical protein
VFRQIKSCETSYTGYSLNLGSVIGDRALFLSDRLLTAISDLDLIAAPRAYKAQSNKFK